YRLYRRKFIKAELTPDVVDKAALNIYIYLKSLLKDTRYQRKNISFFDVIVIIFPYNLLSDLFFIMVFFFLVFFFFFFLFFFLWVLFIFCIFYYGLSLVYTLDYELCMLFMIFLNLFICYDLRI